MHQRKNSIQKFIAGFTLIEILLVIGGIFAVAALTIPVGVNFYRNQILDEATNDIIDALHRAQAQAISQKNDSAFGVKFLGNSYILFQGLSYAGRIASEDETFVLPLGLATAGISEVVFFKSTGLPSVMGIWTVSLGSSVQSISINAQGTIEKQ